MRALAGLCEHLCQSVVDGGRLEVICIVICHGCLVRSTVAYCSEDCMMNTQEVRE